MASPVLDARPPAMVSPHAAPAAPVSPDALPRPGLDLRIAAATRAQHTHLNRLILSLLPLALPPADARLYAAGLTHIAPIYTTLETLWASASAPNHASAAMLSDLRLPALLRSEALRADIRQMTRLSPAALDDRLAATARDSTALASLLDRMRSAARERPHVLVAYVYIFYMALFSGGRYIRSVLGGLPTSFFRFDVADEDALKAEFKRRLLCWDAVLDDACRDDIVAEAGVVFDGMGELVAEMAWRIPALEGGCPGRGRGVCPFGGMAMAGEKGPGAAVGGQGLCPVAMARPEKRQWRVAWLAALLTFLLVVYTGRLTLLR